MVSKENSRGVWIVIIAVLAAVLLTVIGIAVYTNSPVQKYKKQLKLADRYLEELDYDKAVAAYKAAIEIDPKAVEAYESLAELYLEMNDREGALEILNRGIKRTESRRLEKLLDKTEGSEAVDESTESSQTEAEEIREKITAGSDTDNEAGTEPETNGEAEAEQLTEEEPDQEMQEETTDPETDATGEDNGTDAEEQPDPGVDDTAWKQAYLGYIKNEYLDLVKLNHPDEYSEAYVTGCFIYIDDDDIPEMALGYPISSYTLVSFHNGKVQVHGDPYGGPNATLHFMGIESYMNRGGIFLYTYGGNYGYGQEIVRLSEAGYQTLHYGDVLAGKDEIDPYDPERYVCSYDGTEYFGESAYFNAISRDYDRSRAQTPSYDMSYDEIMVFLGER